MRIIYNINRLKEKIERYYRKKLFKEQISCKHNDFSIIGKITTINKNIKIGKNVTIYPGVMFWGDGLIEIGDNCDIGKDTIIYASKHGGVYIGSNTNIAGHCYIIDMDHGIHKNQLISMQENSVQKVEIGNDCWIAANVTILKGSNIQDGAIIGAKSLVKGEIEKLSIAVGIPAKVIKYRK